MSVAPIMYRAVRSMVVNDDNGPFDHGTVASHMQNIIASDIATGLRMALINWLCTSRSNGVMSRSNKSPKPSAPWITAIPNG